MRTRYHTMIRCDGCGQVYHVPASSEERRAKCRPCGNEFVIPIAVVREVKGQTSPSGSAAADRYAAARLASAGVQQVVLQRTKNRGKFVIVRALLLLGTLVVVAHALSQKPAATSVANLNRGRVAKLSVRHSAHEYESVTSLIEAVEPSVVQIETSHGYGSGFVLDESGLIVTCSHCIRDAFNATVVFADGRRLKVLGTAAVAPECDVAILQVESCNGLVPLSLANTTPKKGQPLVAFGSPGGLSFSGCEGSVSGLRTVEELAKLPGVFRMSRTLGPEVSLVQVSATLMPGNSGGPIVDFAGNVMGISSFLFNWQGQKFEFCIAANEIRRIVDGLDGNITPLWSRETLVPFNYRFPSDSILP